MASEIKYLTETKMKQEREYDDRTKKALKYFQDKPFYFKQKEEMENKNGKGSNV